MTNKLVLQVFGICARHVYFSLFRKSAYKRDPWTKHVLIDAKFADLLHRLRFTRLPWGACRQFPEEPSGEMSEIAKLRLQPFKYVQT